MRSETISPTTAPLLSVDRVTLQYRTRRSLVTATDQVSFDVFPADRFILLGPSGCGKSSLLKAVGGFLRPVAGQIVLNGRKIERPGPDRMMVFQEFDQLFPWKTVRNNVAFSLIASRRFKRADAFARADHYVELVQLGKFAHAYPHELSGGMKQRVAIARALAMEPAILLMDEPFAALDALTRRRMQDDLLALSQAVGSTILFVTHSIEEALILGTRILVLSPHPGRVRRLFDGLPLTDGLIDAQARPVLRDELHALLLDHAREEDATAHRAAMAPRTREAEPV